MNRYFLQTEYWLTKEGETILIPDIQINHLENICAMLRRNACPILIASLRQNLNFLSLFSPVDYFDDDFTWIIEDEARFEVQRWIEMHNKTPHKAKRHAWKIIREWPLHVALFERRAELRKNLNDYTMNLDKLDELLKEKLA